MATRISPLSIAARRGTSGTLGAPDLRAITSSSGAIGALPDDMPEPGTPGVAEEATAGEAAPQQTAPGWSPNAQIASRAPASSAPSAPARAASLAQGVHPVPAAPAAGTSVRVQPLSIKELAAYSTDEAALREMHSLKVLSRLVCAIVRRPGSATAPAVKAAILAALIKASGAAAQRLVSSIGPLDAHRNWVRASAAEAAASVVASQWEQDVHDELRPVDEQLDAIEGVLNGMSDDRALAAVIEDLGTSRYVRATDHETAANRVALSARLAAWDLHSHVCDPILGKGAFRFTYGKTPNEIVARLLPDLIAIARDAAMVTADLDVRTSHMQGTLRRVADLMGAEYVARTRSLMNWIADESISDEEYRARYSQGCAMFEKKVAPEVADWARRNFFSIEAMAAREVEGLHQQRSTQADPAQRPQARPSAGS